MCTKDEMTPFDLFSEWYQQAGRITFWRRILTWLYPPAVIHQPDAMTLATVSSEGRPSARILLLKGVEKGRFIFFTNYTSQKAYELVHNPNVALIFHWAFPERQVRVEGVAEKVSRDVSLAYWKKRPRGSQLSGMASPQSSVIF